MKPLIKKIKEHKISQYRLGRHINHDPRSFLYRVAPAKVDVSVVWARHIPILDQGNLGSCTGNAECGEVGCTPCFEALPKGVVLDEDYAVKIYSLATKLDPYQGEYPPDDTGSDGLSVCKAAQQLGLISGYVHAMSLNEAKTLIQQGPFIFGTIWTTNLDSPNSDGFVKYPAKGTVRGGHEILCRERDAQKGWWWFDNSWGADWGKNGRFAIDDAGLTALLAQDGDMTQSVPVSEPPPDPNPNPDPDLATWWLETKPWATSRDWSSKTKAGKAALACIDLANKKGLT